MITQFIFESFHTQHASRGEGQELKEMSTNESDPMTERTKQDTFQVLMMKATDHQPWRDACLLPSLS